MGIGWKSHKNEEWANSCSDVRISNPPPEFEFYRDTWLKTVEKPWNDVDTYSQDASAFARLSKRWQMCLIMVFGFFSKADAMVTALLSTAILTKFTNPWIRALYLSIAHQEVIHDRTYNAIIQNVLSSNDREKMESFLASSKALGKKIEYASRWDECTSMEELLILLMAIEYIQFQPAFLIIEAKNRDAPQLPIINKTNGYIRSEENLHGLVGAYNLRSMPDRPPKETVLKILREVVELEKEVCREIMRVEDGDDPLPGLSENNLCRHVEFMANYAFAQVYPDDPPPWGHIEVHPLAANFGVDIVTNNFETTNLSYTRFTPTLTASQIPETEYSQDTEAY